MKNMLLKFAGFFVERVPDEQTRQPRTPQSNASQASPQHAEPAHPQAPPQHLLQGTFSSPSGTVAMPEQQQTRTPATPLSVALRAWVPHEYASYLTPHGLHVIAAGGEVTPEQARAYGAQVLLVSAECLGSHTHLLSNPQLPTVFVTPSQILIPPRAGVVQIEEPIRASEIAAAARQAVDDWQRRSG